jgi:hypothetical protein
MTKTYYMRENEKGPRVPPFSLRLTLEERAKLDSRAGNLHLGAYIKSVLFAEDAPTYRQRRKGPIADQKALADVLACLGASRLSQNLNQLAKAANIGDLYFDEETKRLIGSACSDIKAMRQMLMQALGLKSFEPPANESVSQNFARQAAQPAPVKKRFGL